MNIHLVPKFTPITDGRTLIDLCQSEPPQPGIRAPTQAEIDRIAFALSELRFKHELERGKSA